MADAEKRSGVPMVWADAANVRRAAELSAAATVERARNGRGIVKSSDHFDYKFRAAPNSKIPAYFLAAGVSVVSSCLPSRI
jgi:hypothetical protein